MFLVISIIVGHLNDFHNEGSIAILLDKYFLIIGHLTKLATSELGRWYAQRLTERIVVTLSLPSSSTYLASTKFSGILSLTDPPNSCCCAATMCS